MTSQCLKCELHIPIKPDKSGVLNLVTTVAVLTKIYSSRFANSAWYPQLLFKTNLLKLDRLSLPPEPLSRSGPRRTIRRSDSLGSSSSHHGEWEQSCKQPFWVFDIYIITRGISWTMDAGPIEQVAKLWQKNLVRKTLLLSESVWMTFGPPISALHQSKTRKRWRGSTRNIKQEVKKRVIS